MRKGRLVWCMLVQLTMSLTPRPSLSSHHIRLPPLLDCKQKQEQENTAELARRDVALAEQGAALAELKEEHQAVVFKYKTLRVEVDDFKESEAKLKQTQKSLQEELAISTQRFTTLKSHAEAKLEG